MRPDMGSDELVAMRQFKELWDSSMRGGLAHHLQLMNNFYGMGGQTAGETMALIGLGSGRAVNPESMHSGKGDGYNPLAVVDAIKRKKALIEEGEDPFSSRPLPYRYSGHLPSDASSYRLKEEIDAWQQLIPLWPMPRS